MVFELGVIFALGALVFWGFGDFLLQRSSRKFGDWETLFFIDASGVLLFLPFVYSDVWSLFASGDSTLFVLIGAGAVLLVASILDLEALKKGKIAVVEPIYALEVPIAAVLAFLIVREAVDIVQILFVTTLLAGIVLVSTKSRHLKRKSWIERGVFLTIVGAIFMGSSNFMLGFASRVTNPLIAAWVTNLFTGTVSLYYLITNKRIGNVVRDFRQNTRMLSALALFDNLAWLSYATAASLIPIAIATALSESYIVLATVLGLIVNKEVLMKHQKVGLVVAISSAIALAAVFG